MPRSAPQIGRPVRLAVSLRACVMLLTLAAVVAGQGPASPGTWTLLTQQARRPLATVEIQGHDMVALTDLAGIFQLLVREDTAARAVTVTYRNQTIVLTPEQTLVSVAGRLVSLPAPLTRQGQRWLVPVEFLNRALGLVYEGRIELRAASRLIIAGDVQVPRVAALYEASGNSLRITFEITPKAATTLTQEQGRLLLRFDTDAIDASLPAPPPQGFLSGVRALDPTTVELSVGPRFTTYRTSTPTSEGASARLVIELMASATEAAPGPAPPPEAPSLPSTPARATIRTIVIDPGHGGEEAGASGPAGTLEKDVVLTVARRLRGGIETRLGIRVLLTRDDDRHVDADDRAAFANNNKADLFISLHGNMSPLRESRGASVFFLGLDRFGEEARRQAQEQREILPVYGGGTREITLVQWELAQAPHVDESAALAGIVEERLRGQVVAATSQRGPMRVLAGANMPAVLIELGYLSNPEEEEALTSNEVQNRIVQAIVEAVIAFRTFIEQGSPAQAPDAISRPVAAAAAPLPQ